MCVCETQVETGLEERWSQRTPPSHEEVFSDYNACAEFNLFYLLVSAPLLLPGIVVANNVNSAVIYCVIASTTVIALITV